jgi:hypothetical protein
MTLLTTSEKIDLHAILTSKIFEYEHRLGCTEDRMHYKAVLANKIKSYKQILNKLDIRSI